MQRETPLFNGQIEHMLAALDCSDTVRRDALRKAGFN